MVIGLLATFILLLFVVIVFIVVRHRRRRLNNNHKVDRNNGVDHVELLCDDAYCKRSYSIKGILFQKRPLNNYNNDQVNYLYTYTTIVLHLGFSTTVLHYHIMAFLPGAK